MTGETKEGLRKFLVYISDEGDISIRMDDWKMMGWLETATPESYSEQQLKNSTGS